MGHFKGAKAESSNRAILKKLERIEEAESMQNDDLLFRQSVAEVEEWFKEKQRIFNSEEEKRKREEEYRKIQAVGEMRKAEFYKRLSLKEENND